jgi:voltage-gated potassium channel
MILVGPIIMEVSANASPASNLSLRERTYHFLNSTKAADGAAHAFNLFIIALILLNITAMVLESVKEIRAFLPRFFWWFECFSVAVFSVEYTLRVWSCVEEPKYRRPILGRLRFAVTPLALVDLSAVLPFYLRFIPTDLRIMRMFRMIRIMRIMRIARVAKLGRYSESFQMLLRIVQSRREPLLSSLAILLILAVVSATLMFYAENKAQPKAFSSIPASMWWAVATLTTIGYGDVYPVTVVGKFMASIIAVLGIGMFALPTGILGSGFMEELEKSKKPRKCPHCGREL